MTVVVRESVRRADQHGDSTACEAGAEGGREGHDPAAAHAPSIVGASWRAPGSVSRKDLPGRPSRCSSDERPAHPLRELVGDREAETGALAAARSAVEAVEQALGRRGVDRRPVIGHDQLDDVVRLASPSASPRRPAGCAAARCRRAPARSARRAPRRRSRSPRRCPAAVTVLPRCSAVGGEVLRREGGDAGDVDLVVGHLRRRRHRAATGRAGRWRAASGATPGRAWWRRTRGARPGSSSSSSSSRNPPSANSGVRSSCEALAMNSRRARSVRSSRRRMSSNARASSWISSRPSSVTGVARLPAAIRRVARSSRRMRAASANAASRPTSQLAGRRSATAISTSRCTVSTVRSTSFSGETNRSDVLACRSCRAPDRDRRLGREPVAGPHGAGRARPSCAPRARAGRRSRRGRCPRPGGSRRGRSASASTAARLPGQRLVDRDGVDRARCSQEQREVGLARCGRSRRRGRSRGCPAATARPAAP